MQKKKKKVVVGPNNLTTPTYIILGPRPTPRREKWPRTNKESLNSLETLLRTILLSASPNPKRKEQHASKGNLPERPQEKDKYSRIPMGVWCKSNSRRNCHLCIKCTQLTF